MNGYCSVTLVGNLGKDPEIRSTPSGKKVANFSVAVNQGYGDNQKTEWVNCVSFGQQADLAEKYLKKGKLIGISGFLQTSSWDDKQTGAKRYKTEVVTRDITFLDSGKSDRSEAPARRESAAPARREAPPDDPFDEPSF